MEAGLFDSSFDSTADQNVCVAQCDGGVMDLQSPDMGKDLSLADSPQADHAMVDTLSLDASKPDALKPDAAPSSCTVFSTSIKCSKGWNLVFVGTTGSNGGRFTYQSKSGCVSITDVNCNKTSSVGSGCAINTITVTHKPCDNKPPCSVTFDVNCP